MTRKDLAYKLQSNYGYDLSLSKLFVQVFFDTIRDKLQKSETVKLSSFGTFSIVQKSARPGRNLRTGEEVEISARKVVRFVPSRKLRVNSEENSLDASESKARELKS
nr:HU family DNA-binding protein [Psittacicella melopsittaci]